MNNRLCINANDIRRSYKSKKYAEECIDYFSELLPITQSSDLAGIVANLLTDGHIAAKPIYKSKKYDYIGFFSDDITDLKSFNDTLERIFNIRGKIRKWGKRYNSSSTGCIIPNARLASVLEHCGVPVGDKVITEYCIPEWIRFGSIPIKRTFLRRSFTCEGSINYDSSCRRWEIRYAMHKEKTLLPSAIEYLEQLRDMLKHFGIETSKPYIASDYCRSKDKKNILGLAIKIIRKDSIKNFHKIGFDLAKKSKRLEHAVRWASSEVKSI